MRRIVFGTAIALLLPLLVAPKISGQATKPNIVVVMLDDFDTASVARMAEKGMLPNIKRYLIDEGVTFTEAFSTSTFGAPTRATFLTGQYPHNHREIGAEPFLGEAPRFNQSSTVATWLKKAGYFTAMVGRYTTGYGYATSPTFIPPGWNFWAGLVDPSTWSTSSFKINLGGTVIDLTPYNTPTTIYHQTDVLSVLSRLFIQETATIQQPLFLVTTPVVYNREMWPSPDITNMCPDPTVPLAGGNFWGVTQRPPQRHLDTIFGDTANFGLFQPPSFNEDDVSDKPDWLQVNPLMTPEDIDCRQKAYWRRLESLRGVDDLVGDIVNSLSATGRLANTYIFLTSDNGMMDGQHRFPEKMPAYEEAIRVPLYVRVPGNLTARTNSRLVLNTDLAPTIASLALTVPGHAVDGRSLVPLLQNVNPTTWRKLGLIEHSFSFTGDPGQVSPPPSYLALRVQSPTPLTYVRYPGLATGVTGELYDLAADPYQLDNRFLDPARATEINRLNTFLAGLYYCRGTGCVNTENAW